MRSPPGAWSRRRASTPRSEPHATAGVPLVIAGEGPDEPRLRQLAAGGEVRFTGRLTAERLAEVRRDAAVVLVPSRWEEPFGYAVLEAHAAGVPGAGQRRGGLPELVARDAAPARRRSRRVDRRPRRVWSMPARRTRRARATRYSTLARERLGEDRYYDRLMAVYGEAGRRTRAAALGASAARRRFRRLRRRGGPTGTIATPRPRPQRPPLRRSPRPAADLPSSATQSPCAAAVGRHHSGAAGGARRGPGPVHGHHRRRARARHGLGPGRRRRSA